MAFDRDSYLASIPSSQTVQEALLGALRAVCSVEVTEHKHKVGLLNVSADGCAFEIWIVPESKGVGSETYQIGEFNWNGRWNIAASWSKGRELKLRPQAAKIEEAIASVVSFVRDCVELEHKWERGEGLTVVPLRKVKPSA